MLVQAGRAVPFMGKQAGKRSGARRNPVPGIAVRQGLRAGGKGIFDPDEIGR